jgi:hypothetical protein
MAHSDHGADGGEKPEHVGAVQQALQAAAGLPLLSAHNVMMRQWSPKRIKMTKLGYAEV